MADADTVVDAHAIAIADAIATADAHAPALEVADTIHRWLLSPLA